jgi:tetratricopeptide (TPR) repeat protein
MHYERPPMKRMIYILIAIAMRRLILSTVTLLAFSSMASADELADRLKRIDQHETADRYDLVVNELDAIISHHADEVKDLAAIYKQRGVVWRLYLDDHAKAIKDFDEAIRINPKYAEAYIDRGSAWRSKDIDKAIASYTEAIRVAPNSETGYSYRASAWLDRHIEGKEPEYDKAIADYTKAIALRPSFGPNYSGRAYAWSAKGEYAKATSDYDKAMTRNPTWLDRRVFARLLATCPDPKFRNGKKAVELATKALQHSDSRHWLTIATLAAAYAESGDVAAAVRLQTKAVEQAPEEIKKEFLARVELYKAGKTLQLTPGTDY